MWSLLFFSCTEPLPDKTPYVSEARVLAVAASPAETVPGDAVEVSALYADSSGPLDEVPISWSFCVVPRPLDVRGPVSETCLDPTSSDLAPIGDGASIDTKLPDDGCSLFGPNPPPSADGVSAGRPADPDITGGFYQPIVGFEDDAPSVVAAERIRCGLANVSQETAAAWNSAYHSNMAPRIAAFDANGTDGTKGASVAAGTDVTLWVAWDECPVDPVCGDAICSAGEDLLSCAEDCNDPVGCGGAESYVVYDPATSELVTRREAISATWFTTGGTLAEARNGVDGESTTTSVENTWTAPATSGDAWIFVVLRDERGGVVYGSYPISVGP
jgi:hypothetical protein